MPLDIFTVHNKLKQGRDYLINSDYDVIFSGGGYSDAVNEFSDYIETVSIPAATISTTDSRTANSLVAKMAGDITYEDLEITWRVTKDFKILNIITNWMNESKSVDSTGFISTGYWDDYCAKYKCQITTGGTTSKDSNGNTTRNKGNILAQINGLYPISRQAVSFSTEGGEYVKFTASFSCYHVVTDSNLFSF